MVYSTSGLVKNSLVLDRGSALQRQKKAKSRRVMQVSLLVRQVYFKIIIQMRMTSQEPQKELLRRNIKA